MDRHHTAFSLILDRLRLHSFNYQDDRGMTYMLIEKIRTEQFKSLSGVKIEYENLKIEAKEKLA
ncbi:MAG: hypothetical protein Q7J78_06940, partial [Clostridiales bacterium]|nr:hypothetical protein [Clostridiales bacterium]